MGNRAKRWMSILMAAGITLTSVLPASAYTKPQDAESQLHAGYAKEETAYQIYPVPQDIEYENGTFELTENVNVVYETGIDEYTKNFLKEILEKYGRTVTESAAVVSGKSNILVGVNGSGGAADQWKNAHTTVKDSSLFTREDAYVLDAENGTVAIVGKDTTAAYCGLATLQMMFSSFGGTRFLNAEIEDWACLAVRGFIEGFYGGWNYPARKSLMRFARDFKMNTYVYASKTDSYHKNDALYPADQIAQIADLVQVGKETKVEYAWSVHISYFFNRLQNMTVGSDAYNTAFDENYTKLIAKFQQLYDAGVRKFDILNDDFGSGTHAEVVRLLNKLDTEFIQPKGCERMTYCPQGYNRGWSGNGAELRELQNLSQNIDLYWTGDDVNWPITQDTVDFVREKTNHDPVFWLNYPVNEHAKSGVYLGNITYYARDNVTGLAGGVSNPCRFAEANKVGLFQLAALFWNNHNYVEKADEIWEEAFKYLQPEVYDAYLTIARNVSNCPNSSRVRQGFPESEYLKDTLDRVSAAVNSGESLEDNADAQALAAEFAHIKEAIAVFRSDCENQTLVSELDPWLNSLNDIASAGIEILDAMEQLQKNDIMGGWERFSAASQHMETQGSYPSYVDGTTNGPAALAGSRYLAPFVKEMVAYAKGLLKPFLGAATGEPEGDPDPVLYAKLGGRELTPDAESAKILDGDPSTSAIYNTNQVKDDYYGIDFQAKVQINSVSILQGRSDTDQDIFNNSCLEYSDDGVSWTEIASYTEATDNHSIERTNLGIQARYIRLRLTKKGTANKADFWTHIREFAVDWEEIKKYNAMGSNEELASAEVALEDKTYSLVPSGSVSLAPGEYVGVKLTELAGIAAIDCKGTGLDGLTVQYSENGVIWIDAPEVFAGQAGRYVRLYNGTENSVSAALESLHVTVTEAKMKLSVAESSFASLAEGSWKNLFDSNTSTVIRTNTAQAAGQYVLVDLGVTTPVYDFVLTTPDDSKIVNAKIQVSGQKDGGWEDIAEIKDGGGDAVREDIFYRVRKNLEGKEVRYVKILLTGGADGVLQICDLDINKTVADTSRTIYGNVKGDLTKIIDGSISSIFTAEEPSDGKAYIEYKVTEDNKMDSVIFLQDASAITNARVSARVWNGTSVETRKLGILNAGSKEFAMNPQEAVLSFKVEWPAGTVPALYEIIKTKPESGNLAAGCQVTESGSGLQAVGNAVDGNMDSRWEGNAIKGGAATTTSWITLDLGANRTVYADSMKIYFYLKTYATDYDVQTSANGTDWTTIKTQTNQNGDTRDLINELTLEKPIQERYVRLFFRSMNANAAGHAVGIREIEINGTLGREVAPDPDWNPDDYPDWDPDWYPDQDPGTTKPDKTELQNTLNAAKAKDLSGYTEESADAFRKALADVEKILQKADASQQEVDAALQALRAAEAGLQAKEPVRPTPPAAAVPAVGETYDVGVLRYKVTKSDAANGTVTVAKLLNKKKAKVVIPTTVTLEGYTFKVTAIAAKAFQKSQKLKAVVIGSNVTSIGKSSFANCKKLKTITFKGLKAPKIGKKAWKGTAKKCKVVIPKKMKAAAQRRLKKAMKGAGISKAVKYRKK